MNNNDIYVIIVVFFLVYYFYTRNTTTESFTVSNGTYLNPSVQEQMTEFSQMTPIQANNFLNACVQSGLLVPKTSVSITNESISTPPNQQIIQQPISTPNNKPITTFLPITPPNQPMTTFLPITNKPMTTFLPITTTNKPCNNALCNGVINSYKQKGWGYTSSSFNECSGCKTVSYPNNV